MAIIVDALVKWWAVINGEVRVNQGISLGIPMGDLVVWLVVGVLLIVIWMQRRQWNAGVALLLAGGLGNLVDRLVYGAVVDMFYVTGIGLWFNLADVYIVVGLLVFLLTNINRDDAA